MQKSEVEEVTSKALAKGGVLAKLYFDMESEKAEDLQPLMADLINNRLLKSPGVVYCYGMIEEPIKLEKNYSTSATLTVLFQDLWSLLNVSFAFTPAGIEILKPEKEYVLRANELQTISLNVAQISLEYSDYILKKVLSREDYEKITQDMRNREELGKRLMEKKEGEEKK